MGKLGEHVETASCVTEQAMLPLLVQLATPVPGNLTGEPYAAGRLEGVGSELIETSWEVFGAKYQDHWGVWVRDGIPLVEDRSFVLGTRTVTEMREEMDDDED